jgi:hypothetical protein
MNNQIATDWINYYFDLLRVPWDTLAAAAVIIGACALWSVLARRQVQMPAFVAVESLEAELEFIDSMMQSHLPAYDKDKAWLVERNLQSAREQLQLAAKFFTEAQWQLCLERADHGMVQICMLRRNLGLKHEL